MDDVIVVGAGPSGSTAGRLLAMAGLNVRILEAKTLPRIKPCGGALTTRALGLLPDGYQAFTKSHPTQWTFSNGNRQVTIESPTAYCHTVERQYFDQWLAEEASAAGAQLMQASPVASISSTDYGYRVATQDGAQYATRYLVGADGGHGLSARLLGFPRAKNGAAIEVEIAVSDAVFALWEKRVEVDIARYPWGYAWVIPRYPILNIGVGSFRPQKLGLKSLLQDYLSTKLSGFPLNSPLKPLAHPLPYRTHFSTLAHGRALLVGDAAGLMDAFSAEGIYSALRTGHLAAETIIAAAEHDTSVENYQRLVKTEFWPNLNSAIKMAYLFYPLAKFWSEIFLRDPHLLEHYLRVAQGKAKYQDLLQDTKSSFLAHAKIRLPKAHPN